MARRLLIPAALAIVLAGCGEDSAAPAGAEGEARECADRWNAADTTARPYMADIAKGGGEDAFVGRADDACVIYAQNPGDQGELFVFTESASDWPAPKRADVPELRRLEPNARILAGGDLELDR